MLARTGWFKWHSIEPRLAKWGRKRRHCWATCTADGSGPFPAAVVLTGCDGINEHYLDAAATLKSWGYVALVLDALGGGDACKEPPLGAQAEQLDALPGTPLSLDAIVY